MAEENHQTKKPMSADWLVQGVLAKLGDALDKLTGRSWKPSSSLATSELAEKLKALADAEARETEDHRRYVPHNIKLKTQWDKFSTDSEEAIKTLEVELLTSLVDHINDRRYYTYAPISLQVKPDYFTTGVKLFASFDLPDGDEREVSLDIDNAVTGLPEAVAGTDVPAGAGKQIRFQFQIGEKKVDRTLELEPGRRLTVGRTNESDIALDDQSISKLHAAIVLNRSGELLISDTGSTNGTFVGNDRIAYGKAIPVPSGQRLKFGTVDVDVIVSDKPVDEYAAESESTDKQESYQVGEFNFAPRDSAGDLPDQSHPPRSAVSPASVTAILTPLSTEANGSAKNVIKDDEGDHE